MSENKYVEDVSVDEGYYSEGLTSGDIIKYSAITLGSVAAYKKGLLKPIIKEAMDMSAKHKPALSMAFNDVRRWMKLEEGVNLDSIFRQDGKTMIKNLVFNNNKETAQNIVNATKDDVRTFLSIFNDSLDRAITKTSDKMIYNSHLNTGLLNEVKRAKGEINKMPVGKDSGKITMRSKTYDAILKKHYVSDEALDTQIKRTGHRYATLDDLFKFKEEGEYIRLHETSNFNFSKNASEKMKRTPKQQIEDMLNHRVLTEEGHSTFIGSKEARFKDKFNPRNIILDKSILINESEEIIDLRTKVSEGKKLVSNLATEWKIPVINVNPLKLGLEVSGLDRRLKPRVNFGYISEESIAPTLTGKWGNKVENTIKNVKNNHEKLKDVRGGIMVIDGDVYTLGKGRAIKKLDYGKQDITFVGKNKAHNAGSLTHYENSQLKMMGISRHKFGDYTPADGDKYVKQRIAKFFDIGRQENNISKESFDTILEAVSPDSYVEKLLSKMNKNFGIHKSKDDFANLTEMIHPGLKLSQQDTVILRNRSTNMKDVIAGKFNRDDIKNYAMQYIADFKKNPELVNNKTGVLHFFADRLSTSISSVGLGLSIESSTGPIASATNLITKRFLPIYGAYQGWNVLNAITEGEDKKGQRTNLNRTVMEGVSKFDIGASYIRDKLGITNLVKNVTQLTPGYDQIEELPGISMLNLDKSSDERRDYWEYGRDAVRKGRFWALNTSTSFTGGKIEYFKLNPLQAAKSDAKFSDSQFGSRKEYFKNILNPYHYDEKHYQDRPYLLTSPAFENVPLVGPILGGTIGKVVKPQVKMHQEYWNGDEPKTNEQLKMNSPIADINQQRMLSKGASIAMSEDVENTLNQVYRERSDDLIQSHMERARELARAITFKSKKWANGITNTFSGYREEQKEKQLTSENALMDVTEPYTNIKAERKDLRSPDDSAYYEEVNKYNENPLSAPVEMYKGFKDMSSKLGQESLLYKEGRDIYYNSLAYQPTKQYSQGEGQIKVGDGVSISPNNKINTGVEFGKYKNLGAMMAFDKNFDVSEQNVLYRTGSGKINVVNTGKESDAFIKVNKEGESPQSFIGTSKNTSITDNYIINSKALRDAKERNIESSNGLKSTFANQVANSANVAGIYGFGFNTAIAGDIQKGRTVIDTPGYSRSFNKSFWDNDLGGFGGDVSEIFRRLVQKKVDNGVNYYDPIRNTMPDWMPGKDGFVDFQHGDPYSKIKKGEERLPGEGFERAYGINIDDYNVSASQLGKSKDEIIKHYLNKDSVVDEDIQGAIRKGSKIHERIEDYIYKNHIAIDRDIEIEDKNNGIKGKYDARIKDVTSKTGEAILNIKAVGSNDFEDIVESGQAREKDAKSMNFFLHNTNKDNNGEILYVNRDDASQMHIAKVGYSRRMYNESISNVKQARSEVKGAIDSGQISRAERYKPLDKLTILADVAPYSQEYNDMLKQVRSLDLNDKDKNRLNMIEDMVSKQRKQLRTYDYRFKTADVVSEKVKIESQIDDDKFMTSGFDDPIKLAGIKMASKTDDEETYNKAMNFLKENVKGKVEVKVAKDEYLRNNKDSLKSMNAVVYANGMNINRELIKRGLAKENEKDFSAAGVHARFNGFERTFGNMWETVAHQNTVLNNRILRVRSAVEDYERQQVYNKDFKDWKKPISDYLVPAIWGSMADESSTDRVVGAVTGALAGSFFGSIAGGKGRLVGTAIGAGAGATVGTSLLAGAFIGSLFGSGGATKSKFGKLLGATVGASLVGAGKLYKHSYEARTGEKWIPKEKRRENEVIEYLDKIKYVKNRRLFEVYAKKAMVEDGIDVKQLLAESKENSDKRRSWSKKVENVKMEQKKTGKFNTKDYEKLGVKFNDNDKRHFLFRKDEGNKKDIDTIKKKQEVLGKEQAKSLEFNINPIKKMVKNAVNNNMNLRFEHHKSSKEIKTEERVKEKKEGLKKSVSDFIENSKNRKQRALEKTVNDSIKQAKETKDLMVSSPNAMKAIEYYNKSEETMYGYDPGDNISTFVKALPKKDRKYFNEFLKAGEKERKEILKIAPKYMKRALESSYGMKVEGKESLSEYFSKHYLPDENWDGWQEGMDFDAIKTKVISREGFNLANHDIWDDNKLKADMYGAIPIPNIDHRTKQIEDVKNQLASVLGEAGYQDLEIDVKMGVTKPSINLDLYESKKEKFEQRIRERMN